MSNITNINSGRLRTLEQVIESQLSVHAKQLILYLTQRPKNWIPNTPEIKKHLKCGDGIWRRVSRELRQAGYLRIKKGGIGHGGSQLEFDINRSFK